MHVYCVTSRKKFHRPFNAQNELTALQYSFTAHRGGGGAISPPMRSAGSKFVRIYEIRLLDAYTRNGYYNIFVIRECGAIWPDSELCAR